MTEKARLKTTNLAQKYGVDDTTHKIWNEEKRALINVENFQTAYNKLTCDEKMGTREDYPKEEVEDELAEAEDLLEKVDAAIELAKAEDLLKNIDDEIAAIYSAPPN